MADLLLYSVKMASGMAGFPEAFNPRT